MNNFKFEGRNFEGLANREGLYRIWVPLHDDGKVPLISVWIDPKMTALESQVLEGLMTPSDTHDLVAEKIKDFGGDYRDSLARCSGVDCARNSDAFTKARPRKELGPH